MESIESVKHSTEDSSFLISQNSLTNTTPIFNLSNDFNSSIDVSSLQTSNLIQAVTRSGLRTFDVSTAYKRVPIADDSSTDSTDETTDTETNSTNSSTDSGIYGMEIDSDPDLLSYNIMIDQWKLQDENSSHAPASQL